MSCRTRLASGALVTALLGSAVVGPAGAVPEDGAGPDTPGTSASVSPSTLPAGGTLRFTLSGFPAGEIVSVKIDDGNFCSDKGVHGACVVHQQRVGSGGQVSGSFQIPADLPVGAHWLRFLASAEVTSPDGTYLGVKGWTRRGGSDFRVVAPATHEATGTTGTATGSSASGSTGQSGAAEGPGRNDGSDRTGTTGTAAQSATVGPAGGVPTATSGAAPVGPGQPVPVSLGDVAATAPAATAPPATPTPVPGTPEGGATRVLGETLDATPAPRATPWWGLAGLVLLLLASALVVRPLFRPARSRG